MLLKLMLTSLTYFSCCSQHTRAEKILLFPFQVESHIITLNAIGTELIKEGHEVYSVLNSQMLKKFGQLRGDGIKPLVYQLPAGAMTVSSEQFQKMWVGEILKGKLQRFHDSVSYQFNKQCDHMELDDAFLGALAAHKFDIAVMDGVDFALCNYLFVSAVEVPYVTVTSFEDTTFTRLPSLPSFVPPISMQSTDRMDFPERLTSFFHFFFPQLTKQVSPSKYHNMSLFNSYLDILPPGVASYNDFPMKSLMTFISRGHMLESPAAHLPTVHSVECLTASDVVQVPKDFSEMLKASTHGYVVVSFGSLVGYLPDATLQILLDAFRTRKELFLMRYMSNKTDHLDVPANVKFFAWLPQNELLGQPGTQLLISQGGNLGQYEALYHGVPTINMPLFADQHHNAYRMEKRGFGLTLQWKDLTAETLAHMLDTVMDEASFKDRTRQAAFLLRSRPLDSRQVAAFWIDHVIQFGDDHLRSASIDLPWSKYWMLDILAFLFCLAVGLLVAIGFLVRWLVGPLRKKEQAKEKKS